MRTGDAARQFGITTQAVRKWIDRYGKFLSDGAKAVDSRYAELNSDDFVLLATVHELTHKEKLTHDQAYQRIAEGFRIEDTEAYTIEPDMIPAPAVEQLIDATEIRVALEKVTSERDSLVSLLEHEKVERDKLQTRIDTMQQTIDDLRERAARAETEAKMLREQQDKKRRWF